MREKTWLLNIGRMFSKVETLNPQCGITQGSILTSHTYLFCFILSTPTAASLRAVPSPDSPSLGSSPRVRVPGVWTVVPHQSGTGLGLCPSKHSSYPCVQEHH
uniref:Uncharacterized protein n=1 Tax=Cacopsylla melanoneura TaxID=428564 RepID=A0A8D9FHA8_9HEMI